LFLLLTLKWRVLLPTSRLICTLSVVIIASIVWSIVETQQSEVWAFFSPLTRAWELALGALLAVVGPFLRGRNIRLGWIFSVSGVLAVLLCTWFYSSSTLWPGSAIIIPVVGTGMIIAGGSLRGPENIGRFVNFVPIQWLGKISYSLYLVHWPVIAIATQYAISPLPLHSEIELVAISLFLAAILHYALEDPIRRWQWIAQRRPLTFVFGAALTALSFGAIYWHLSHY
jgi:peptidoglycan/LPS O-acetylase OafA/YrhL